MIFDPTLKVAIITPPRCGTTSLTRMWEELFGYSHLDPLDWHDNYPYPFLRSYRCYAILRNPLPRYLSLFRYFSRVHTTGRLATTSLFFDYLANVDRSDYPPDLEPPAFFSMNQCEWLAPFDEVTHLHFIPLEDAAQHLYEILGFTPDVFHLNTTYEYPIDPQVQESISSYFKQQILADQNRFGLG